MRKLLAGRGAVISLRHLEHRKADGALRRTNGRQSADLPLYATALVLADENHSIAIVDADAIGFDREWTQKIVNAIENLTKIPAARIRFSCTHTHSGPNTFRLGNISEGPWRGVILTDCRFKLRGPFGRHGKISDPFGARLRQELATSM